MTAGGALGITCKTPPAGIVPERGSRCATGALPPSFILRRVSASGTAASEISIRTQKASM